jgi:hypothetical protein
MSIGEIIVTTLLLFLAPLTTAKAGEQAKFYNDKGQVQGTATPQGDGTVKFRDATGKVTGSATTGPDGTTRYYGPDGKSLGTSSGPTRALFPERR